MEKGTWVQYQNGVKTGKTRRTPLPAIKGGVKAVTGLATRPFNQLKKTGNVVRGLGIGRGLKQALHIPNKKQQAEIDKNRKKRVANKSTSSKTKVSDHKDTGDTKLVKGSDGKVRRVKVSNTTKNKTLKGSDTSKMKDVKKDDGGKAAWLKKTRNSPAAKSGAFTDDERWAQQQKHREWKANRKAKTEAKKNKLKATQGKSMPSNPKGMRQEGVGKTAKDLTRHTTGSSKKKKKINFGTL